jgi:hypothetical protein
MRDRTDHIVQALFDKPSLQDCTLQQVDYLAHQYPYFSTAQLLLLKKAESGSEAHAKQLQRAALHFCSPLQFVHWLQPEQFETEMPEAELFQNPMPGPDTASEPEPVVADEIQNELEPAPAQTATPEPVPTMEAVPALHATEPEPPKEATVQEAPAFEPFHTVDYFASQGIKLSQQEATNDTLGRQLKSFTEWLKTMKRLPEVSAPQNPGSAGEHKVERLAAHSVHTADVVTESMAEVWLKQGNREKAADVYRKLSLRNPSKSSYFAAKIESLNKE